MKLNESGERTEIYNWSRYIRIVFIGILMVVMISQIVFSAVWMKNNFDVVPTFGDTVEYLQLSESMSLDEYRPLLYPLLLKVARKISNEHYYRYVFIIQTFLSVISMSYCVFALLRIKQVKERKDFEHWLSGHENEIIIDTGEEQHYSPGCILNKMLIWGIGGLFLNSIPMITFMNFTILTDSIANSLLVLFLSVWMLFLFDDKATIVRWMILLFAAIGQSLIRADRLYICLLLHIIFTIVSVMQNRQRGKKIVAGALGFLLIWVGTVTIVNTATQVKGRNGRVSTNLSFVLLDRVVWPNMVANYDYFPDNIKKVISLEEAQAFDVQNNNVMYQMAPMLEERVGKKQAKEYYRIMAGVVWNRQAGKVLADIGEDFLSFLLSPVMHYQALRGIHRSNNVGWNMHCLSGGTPELTRQYDDFGFMTLILSMGISLVLATLLYFERRFPSLHFPIWVFLLAAVIISLWFSVGDGAPPNDRYTLIAYVFYYLIPVCVWIDGLVWKRY